MPDVSIVFCGVTMPNLNGPQTPSLLPSLDLLRCTEEPNVSIPTLANLLLERTQNQNWIVVFKSLVTIHHLMCYGNEVSFSFFFFTATCVLVGHREHRRMKKTLIVLSAFHSILGIQQYQFPAQPLSGQEWGAG